MFLTCIYVFSILASLYLYWSESVYKWDNSWLETSLLRTSWMSIVSCTSITHLYTAILTLFVFLRCQLSILCHVSIMTVISTGNCIIKHLSSKTSFFSSEDHKYGGEPFSSPCTLLLCTFWWIPKLAQLFTFLAPFSSKLWQASPVCPATHSFFMTFSCHLELVPASSKMNLSETDKRIKLLQ